MAQQQQRKKIMNAKDRPEFVRIISALATLKRSTMTAEAFELFFSALNQRNWTIEEFRTAATYLASECRFMPDPHDFELVRSAGTPTADEAWSTALKQCIKWREKNCSSGNALIDKIVHSLGGWQRIAHANNETELPHIRRNFMQAHDSLSERVKTREAVPEIAAPQYTDQQIEDHKHRLRSALVDFSGSARQPPRED
jgi:hypothetical protein